ncbi:MAG: hypothetical protein HQ589_01220 [Syntrophaceae bacterium]|nr:hypothetical protein [Syntrophaceae bacterium]
MASQKEYIKLIDQTFRGRRDAYGAMAGLCVKKPLDDTEIRQHLKGIERRGVYPLSPDIMDGSGVFWGCIDVDNGSLDDALEVLGNLNHLGISAYIEASKSKGYHIWTFFSEPIPAKVVRALLAYAVENRGYEIFPKQTTIKTKAAKYGYGNYVNLPLFGKDAPEGRTAFLDTESNCQAFPDQSDFLKSIQKVTPQAVEALINDGEIEIQDDEVLPKETDMEKREYTGGNAQKILDDCAFIQYCESEATTLTEPTWYAMICNLAPLKDGPDLIHQLSEPYPHYTVEETNRKIKHALDVDSPHSCKWIKTNIFDCGRDCGIKCPIQKGRNPGEKPKISDSNPYFAGNKFIPPFLGNALMKDYSFVTATGKIYRYTDGVYTPIDNSVIAKHCRNRLGDYARTNHVSEVLAHISDMTWVEPGELNKHSHLINLKNGMLDWQAAELVDHSPEYLSTMRIPVEYKPHNSYEPVEEMLSQWVNADAIPTLQEFIGYCLIPYTRYEKALMLTGSGANGKSSLIDWIATMIGAENTSNIPLQDLDGHRFKRAEIFGKLLNVFADLPSAGLAGSSYFKMIVTGDRIDGERKGRDPFFFKPFAKLMYSANEIPQSPDNTPAYFRRWIVIDFPNVFEKGENADEFLMDKLTTDDMLSGLFNFGFAGLKRLAVQRCFTEGETTKQQLADYQKANDPVSAFIADRCKVVIGSNIKRKDLFQEFTAYCQEQGYEAVTNRKFYGRVRSHRFVDKLIDGYDYFSNIAVVGYTNNSEKNAENSLFNDSVEK